MVPEARGRLGGGGVRCLRNFECIHHTLLYLLVYICFPQVPGMHEPVVQHERHVHGTRTSTSIADGHLDTHLDCVLACTSQYLIPAVPSCMVGFARGMRVGFVVHSWADDMNTSYSSVLVEQTAVRSSRLTTERPKLAIDVQTPRQTRGSRINTDLSKRSDSYSIYVPLGPSI